MTLYWWMHWFWITALTTCVQRSASQTLPTVQNGHQNGPYAAKPLLENPSTSYEEAQHKINSQQYPRYSTERSTSTNGQQRSELHQDSTPMFRLAPTEDEHSLPTFKSQPVDLLHLEAKENMHENSHFSEMNGHDTYRKNFDHLAVAQSDTTSVPNNKEKCDNSTAVLKDEKSRREDELIHGNNSKAKESANQKIKTGEEQLLGDQPQSDPLDAFNISESTQENTKKALAASNITIDNLPTNKPVGHNYRGKSVNMEKNMQNKARNITALKTKSENVPIFYVTPIPVNTFTNEMKSSEEEGEERNITESNNSVSRMELSKENISITLPTNESLVTVSPDLIIRSLATTENNTSKDSVLQAVSRERIGQNTDGQGLDAASITGIALGILASAALVGTVSFIVYRRRYLNKPQTLNDSNPDSSGYLDDNTLRENSEEMYSLDNDSFLNSLEAMTIQNYWTDSVKHTKL